jgi:hypothetical protein
VKTACSDPEVLVSAAISTVRETGSILTRRPLSATADQRSELAGSSSLA